MLRPYNVQKNLVTFGQKSFPLLLPLAALNPHLNILYRLKRVIACQQHYSPDSESFPPYPFLSAPSLCLFKSYAERCRECHLNKYILQTNSSSFFSHRLLILLGHCLSCFLQLLAPPPSLLGQIKYAHRAEARLS